MADVPIEISGSSFKRLVIVPEVDVKVLRLPHAEGLALPAYMTAGAAGADVRAALGFHANGEAKAEQVWPGLTKLIPLGIKVEIPRGFEIQFRSRSGLASKHSVFVLNAPGTIDSDYRGEMFAILHNSGPKVFTVEHGMRVGQLVIAPVTRIRWDVVEELSETDRGEGGRGSTGVK